MTPEDRARLIDRYSQGPDEVAQSLEGFPATGLTARPLPGKWSAREIVHHLADSESTAAIRLRRLLAEDRPIIQGYDQDEFARRLRYNERDHQPALQVLRGARETTTQVLRGMNETDWRREGWHTESGLYTPEDWLAIYAVHAHDHASQIRRLREALEHR
jgi:hypothetical protein